MSGSASGVFATNQGATAGAARSTPPCHSAPGKADAGGARGAVPTRSRLAVKRLLALSTPAHAGT